MRTLSGCTLESEDGQGTAVAQESSLLRDGDAADQHMPPVGTDFPSRAAENPTGASPIGASSTSTNTTRANLLSASLTGTDPNRIDPIGTNPTGARPTSTDPKNPHTIGANRFGTNPNNTIPNSANLTRTNATGSLPVDALALDPEAYRRRLKACHGQIRLAQKRLDLRDLSRRPAPLQLHRSS
ncbi:hypothetical protein [Microbacterium sp. P26]|uniref:hypothetical protein n=1 Tax=Microbacterium TaxID=33882 RepID=UPI0027DEB403|nr:hypothetical protein [Microbacterium sp. P26]